MAEEGDKPKEVIVSREELIGLVQLVIIFTAILAGREIGNIYGSYNELTHLSVNLALSEAAISNYLLDAMEGRASTLDVGLAITIPDFTSEEGQVTQTPDYVRKWLISVTLSPIVVTQPEVSDVELAMFIEGEQVLTQSYEFPRQKVGYISFIRRNITLAVNDVETLKRLVADGAAAHAGEVEVIIRGRAKTNVLWFESNLPFTTIRYPLVKAPSLVLQESHWETQDGSGIMASVGEFTTVVTKFDNPTRLHSVTQNVTCRFYREGVDEPVASVTKTATAAAGTVSTYFFNITPSEPGVYYYTLESMGRFILPGESLRLTVG